MERSVYYRCRGCNKDIIEGNRLLHEQHCKGPSDDDDAGIIANNCIGLNYPSLDEVGVIDNYKYCVICNNYYHVKEYDDHMLSHQLDEENHDINNHEDDDINLSEYEIIDREEVMKQMEEDRIETEKFKKITNKKSIPTGKKIINYLFNYNGRVPPIVRISKI
jgi:hypothetical protein